MKEGVVLGKSREGHVAIEHRQSEISDYLASREERSDFERSIGRCSVKFNMSS